MSEYDKIELLQRIYNQQHLQNNPLLLTKKPTIHSTETIYDQYNNQ